MEMNCSQLSASIASIVVCFSELEPYFTAFPLADSFSKSFFVFVFQTSLNSVKYEIDSVHAYVFRFQNS